MWKNHQKFPHVTVKRFNCSSFWSSFLLVKSKFLLVLDHKTKKKHGFSIWFSTQVPYSACRSQFSWMPPATLWVFTGQRPLGRAEPTAWLSRPRSLSAAVSGRFLGGKHGEAPFEWPCDKMRNYGNNLQQISNRERSWKITLWSFLHSPTVENGPTESYVLDLVFVCCCFPIVW